MAIEKADLSGSLNRDEMASVVLTPAAQNRGAPDAGENQPRQREPSTEKNSAEPSAEGSEKTEDRQEQETEDSGRPPHRIDRLA